MTDKRLESWSRFMQAVHDAKKGNYARCREMVESVRAKHGDAAAESQRRELWRIITTGIPK